jgi:hypothetical protein
MGHSADADVLMLRNIEATAINDPTRHFIDTKKMLLLR